MQLRQELLTFKNFYEYIPFFIKDTRTLDEFEARIKWDFNLTLNVKIIFIRNLKNYLMY